MKKLLLLILLAIGCNGIFANEYEPKKIFAEVNNEVALFFKDMSGGEFAYTVTLYNVKKSALKKLNNAIKKNRIRFSKMLDVIDEKDLDAEMHGTQEAPDPAMFSRLRNVQVYDIFVTTEENKDVHLQVYAEYFQDAKDL